MDLLLMLGISRDLENTFNTFNIIPYNNCMIYEMLPTYGRRPCDTVEIHPAGGFIVCECSLTVSSRSL